MILVIHFWNGKKIEVSVTGAVVMEFVEDFQSGVPKLYAFMGQSGHNVYVPMEHINYFEVKDVSEKLS